MLLLRTFRMPFFVLVGALGATSPVFAMTSMEVAEDEITCLDFATAEERAQLRGPLLPRPANRAVLMKYFGGAAADPAHERMRYLDALAALAYFADRTNDQTLRIQVLTTVAVFAQRYADAGLGPVFTQVSRCARAAIVSAALESDQPDVAVQIATDLAARFKAGPVGPAPEDWPLLRAMREASLSAEAKTGLGRLAMVALERASALEATEPARASRLYGAVARAMLIGGQVEGADKAAGRALALVLNGGDPRTIAPLLIASYDVWVARYGIPKAAELFNQVTAKFPLPAEFIDPETEYEVRLRAAKALTHATEFDAATAQRIAANKVLFNVAISMPFLRAAFDELDAFDETVTDPLTNMTANQSWLELAKRDPNRAKTDYIDAYRGSYDTQLEQAQHRFVMDARDRLTAERKASELLDDYFLLKDLVPQYRAEIEDRSFGLAQLLSYGRVTLATVSAGLDSLQGDPRMKALVERFFTISTQSSVWLRGIWNMKLGSDGDTLPSVQTITEAIVTLDTLQNETGNAFDRSVAYVRQNAPELGALITPKPMTIAEAQAELNPGQVLIASLVARRFTYVMAITPNKFTMARTEIGRAEVRELVHRLRESLLASSAGGRVALPPFDAGAAHELYRITFGTVATMLPKDAHVIWYGHDALGSVPPAVLVTAPTKDKLATADELATARFFGDAYPVSVLVDLSLLKGGEQVGAVEPTSAFLGVGAPQLSEEELEGESGATVFDFTRGMDAGSLAELPRLPESADELRSLADTFGADTSTLLLGGQATRTGLMNAGPARYRVIAFATHGFKAGEVAGVDEPALLLAPPAKEVDPLEGLLISRQIASLELGADLVILSACNSANGDGRPRTEAFTGLAQAFFTAGARSLLVTHWPVISSAASRLSVTVAEGITRDNLPLDVSLQRAIVALRQSGRADAIEAHPAYWGPFVAVGADASVLTKR